MKIKTKTMRYIEVSRRNPVTRILVGSGSSCSPNRICGDFCLDIRRAGSYNCDTPVKYNACCQPEPVPLCDLNVAHVCALEIDEDGYAIFEWPEELFHFKEGWYEAHLMNGCNYCDRLPLRIGPRCNVIEVEHVVSGPDSACWVGCEPECQDDVCPPVREGHSQGTYNPNYEII